MLLHYVRPQDDDLKVHRCGTSIFRTDKLFPDKNGFFSCSCAIFQKNVDDLFRRFSRRNDKILCKLQPLQTTTMATLPTAALSTANALVLLVVHFVPCWADDGCVIVRGRRPIPTVGRAVQRSSIHATDDHRSPLGSRAVPPPPAANALVLLVVHCVPSISPPSLRVLVIVQVPASARPAMAQ